MLKVETRGAVAVLTLDRAARGNALHPDLIVRLLSELTRLEESDAVRVVVITGAGRNFCAGLDLDELAGLDADGALAYMRSAFDLFMRVHELRQPVIAAVNGAAVAGGFDLAAFCDVRLCSSDARFAQTEIRLGLTQIPYPVHHVIGAGRARDLALTGRMIPAAEAHRIGLVSEVHPPDQLMTATLALAGDLAQRPPQALFATKRLCREVITPDFDSTMTRTYEVIADRLQSAEHAAALDAYLADLRARSSRESG